MRLFSSPLVALALVLGGCGPLSWVTSDELEDRYCDLDEDGDGYKACPDEGIKDCNDDPERGGAFETPNPDGSSPEIPYDGYDNDCGRAGIYGDGPAEWVEGEAANQLPSGDVIDVDGDGYAGIAMQDYLDLNDSADYLADRVISWPGGVDQSLVDCEDYDAFIVPGKQDDPYDGIDADCLCDQDFDVDGDGYVLTRYWSDHQAYLTVMDTADWCTEDLPALETGDCDDNASDGHLSNPGQTTDTWYDGLDSDCLGNNDFDQDGDGWMPEGSSTQLDTYNQKYGYSLVAENGVGDANGFDCEDDPDYPGATVVEAAAVNPAATEQWYDGVDQDCAADNDFDQDVDSWMPTTYTAAFNVYQSYWFGSSGVWGEKGLTLDYSGFNDCDDRDALVHPQSMEYLGDSVDQDCDGGVDSTSFAIGPYDSWDSPRNVEVEYDENNYMLVVISSNMDESGTSKAERGALLWVDPADVGWDTDLNERIWEGTSATNYTLGGGVDVAMHSCGSAFGATSYYNNPKGYLMLRELEWTGSSYTNTNVTFKTEGLDEDPSDSLVPYPGLEDLDVDLQEDDDQNLWVLACGEDRLHTYSVSVSGSCVFGAPDYVSEEYWTAGETCVLDLDTPSGNPHVIVGDSGGLVTWEVDPSLGFTAPASDPWSSLDVNDADSHDGWLIFSMADQGVQIYEIAGSDSYEVLSDYEVFNADAVWHDIDGDGSDELVVVAVVDDLNSDARDDLVLAYGDPDGTMVEAEISLGWDQNGDGLFDDKWSADTVALHVDDDYLFIGATGAGTAEDVVAWTFMGLP